MNFAKAFGLILGGARLARKAWRPGIFVEREDPVGWGVSVPIVIVDTTNASYSSNSAVKGRAPWVPSHCDMFAEDWYIVEPETKHDNVVPLRNKAEAIALFRANINDVIRNMKEVN